MLALWPVNCRTSWPFLASMSRTVPSKPAVSSQCGFLGCHTILTTPAFWSKNWRSTCDGMSQKPILPVSEPVTNRLSTGSGQKVTASTEFPASSDPDASHDSVASTCYNTTCQLLFLRASTYRQLTLPAWVLYSFAVASKQPVAIKLLSLWQSIEVTAFECDPLNCWSTLPDFKSNILVDPSKYPTAILRPNKTPLKSDLISLKDIYHLAIAFHIHSVPHGLQRFYSLLMELSTSMFRHLMHQQRGHVMQNANLSTEIKNL